MSAADHAVDEDEEDGLPLSRESRVSGGMSLLDAPKSVMEMMSEELEQVHIKGRGLQQKIAAEEKLIRQLTKQAAALSRRVRDKRKKTVPPASYKDNERRSLLRASQCEKVLEQKQTKMNLVGEETKRLRRSINCKLELPAVVGWYAHTLPSLS